MTEWWNDRRVLSREQRCSPGSTVIDFAEFGKEGSGPINGRMTPSSDFRVEVDWDDVLIAIERFAVHGNRQAQCLQAVLRCLDKPASCDSAAP